MPHISHYSYQGERLQSVSTITNALAKEGLVRWWRKEGFEECDKQTYEAKVKGSRVAKMFEKYRQRGKRPKSEFLNTVLDQWIGWGEGWKDAKLVAEPHLVNTIDKYHGSPDLVFFDSGKWSLGDDKCKKRFADYGLLMNEHAYATCNMMHDVKTGELTPVPWETPIQDIWFWTYSPRTGKLYPHYHKYDPQVYQDFLICKKMGEVNKKAGKYFNDNAILLSEDEHEEG